MQSIESFQDLETKVNRQCQSSNQINGQLRPVNHTPTDSCQEQQFLDNAAFGLMVEDDFLYSELSASIDSAGLTAVAQMHDSPRPNHQQRVSGLDNSTTSTSNGAKKSLPMNDGQNLASNALTPLGLVPGSTEGSPSSRQHDSLGTSAMQPLRPSGMALCGQVLRDISPEERMSRVLKFIQDAGFKDMDSLMTEYYVGNFDASSHVSAVQRQSRSRRLRGFLEQLRIGSESWSDYEAHDYRHEISKSAEAIYAKELDAFGTTVDANDSFEGLASLYGVLQNNVGSDVENYLRHEQSTMQRQLPHL